METVAGGETQVVVVIPAFQPGPVLVETCASVLAAGCRVVVVDDGSGPEYAPVFQALDARVLLVRHARNRGKGAALKSGLGFVRDACETWGDVVVVTADADGQHRVADVLRVAAVAAEHPGCLVLGTRDFGETRVPTRSRLGNRVASGVFSAATRHRVADTQTGLRACGSALLPVLLRADGSGFDFEMNVLLVCAATGVELVEVPIETVYVGGERVVPLPPGAGFGPRAVAGGEVFGVVAVLVGRGFRAVRGPGGRLGGSVLAVACRVCERRGAPGERVGEFSD